jgi:amino-acid N-acetyltransferase
MRIYYAGVFVMNVERASIGDAEQIKTLIDFYASRGRMLPRSLSEIFEHIRDFFVFKDKNLVAGCCALHVSWSDLAEIRSLAVDPRYANKGIGSSLVSACIGEAKNIGINKVFTLTYEPEFFEKQGFKKVPKSQLPKKIWGECIHCSKYPNCDEEALVYKIK